MPIDDDDQPDLAERARTMLAGGRHALVTLPCEPARGWVGLLDDGGEPVLLVGAGSPPAVGAASRLRGRVDVPGPDGERLVLTGTLRQLPGSPDTVVRRLAGLARTVVVPGDHASDVVALALSVDEVLICLPAGNTEAPNRVSAARELPKTSAPPRPTSRALGWPPARTGMAVDLAAYALAEPDLVAAYAPELIGHLNVEHADQVRRLASRVGRVDGPPSATAVPGSSTTDDLAGATVASLDRFGMVLWRVDSHGAQQLRIRFRRPLSQPRELGVELRWLLGHSG